MKQKLWIVTELFYPDETATAHILTNMANSLSVKFEVHVLCGPSSSEQTTANSLHETVTVHRTRWLNLDKNRLFSRSVRFLFIALALSFRLLFNSRKSDKVFVVTNPPPMLVMVSMIKLLRKYELCILTHDLFPENVIPAGLLKNSRSLLYKCLIWLFDHSYARADKIIVLGRDMEEIMEKKIRKHGSQAVVKVITNWADTDMIKPEPASGSSDVEIQYAGNLGRVQGLMAFLELFIEADNQQARLSFWGDGVLSEVIRDSIHKHHLVNVEHHGSFTRSEQNAILSHADLCLIVLADGMYGLGVPSKAYNIMAAGKPILYIGPRQSEIWRMVEEKKIGVCYEPADGEAIVEFLKSITVSDKIKFRDMGMHAASIAREEYAKEKILSELICFV